eukprot:778195_1
MYSQQWSCATCTFKQSANAVRCGMCGTANPFMVGSSQSATHFQPQRAPPKPKPVVKNELKYQAKPRGNNQFGKIVYQTERITKQQVLDTYAIYLLNKDIATSCWPLYVFGENDIDKARPKGGERDMIGGLAGILGDYDTSVSFGVTTTFYKNKQVNNDFNAFKSIIDKDFNVLLNYIKHGHDIIVPSPNMQDLYGYYEKSYWKTVDNQKKQVIFHNIGTGIAKLPLNYIEYIQLKCDELKRYAQSSKTVQYYDYSPHSKPQVTQKPQVIYQCPFCSTQMHYLMTFKNCNHSLCAPCLSDFVIRHLNYVNHDEEHRFKCWAACNGKCNARICEQDVNFPKDKCDCAQCKNVVTETGNGTILDDRSLKQFKNIMAAFRKRHKWDTDECPQCKKPFPIAKEWRHKTEDDTDIDPCTCNCCDVRVAINDENVINISSNEEIGAVAYAEMHNNCRVCHQHYCDQCRTNCFYEINECIRAPSPVADAKCDYHEELKLKQDDDDEGVKEALEFCEKCWYEFYCRKCPHCDFIFCGACDAEWKQKKDDHKHDTKSRHSCDEEIRKIEQKRLKEASMKERRRKQRNETLIQANEQLESDVKKLKTALTNMTDQKGEAERKLLESDKKYHEINTQLWQNTAEEYRVIADDEKTKRRNAEDQIEEYKKKMYVVVWQWKENNSTWNSYEDQINKKIDNLNINASLTFTASNSQTYEVTRSCIDKGTQQNMNTNVVREVRRIEQCRGYIEYPNWWNMEGLGMSQGSNYAKPRLIKMDLKNQTAQRVANAFYDGSKNHSKYRRYSNISIVSIESMQNQRLYDKYWNERSIMIRDIGEKELNEKCLWHGTKAEDVMNEIEHTGFRKEFNTTALWGQGTYFAVNSGYSVSYSSNNNGVHKMFQCLVLSGESHVGGSQYTLRTWPKKNGGKRLIYDSLHSKDKDIYVIHDDVRAYPMFVVTFRVN